MICLDLAGKEFVTSKSKNLQVCICFVIYIFIHLFPDIVVHIDDLTLFRMDFFRAAHGWRYDCAKFHHCRICVKSVTNILQWWNLAQLYLTYRRSKNYMNHMAHPLSSAAISIFYQKSTNFAISRNTDIDSI